VLDRHTVDILLSGINRPLDDGYALLLLVTRLTRLTRRTPEQPLTPGEADRLESSTLPRRLLRGIHGNLDESSSGRQRRYLA
jgi:hypothetical protein